MKVDIDLVKCVLQRTNLEAQDVATIIQEINTEVKMAESAKGEKENAVKKQFVFLLSDPQWKFKGDTDYVGWVVQIPEDENPATALEKLHLGAYDFNQSAKGKRYPIKTIAEACEFGSSKIFAAQKIWIKSKEPILVVRTNNKIPTE